MNAIEIRNLKKYYPGFALDIPELILPGGCVMGLIGENGAGKSTAIRLIMDIACKDGGTVTVLGVDNRDKKFRYTKNDIGVVLDECGFPENFSIETVEKIMVRAYRNWNVGRFHELLEKFSIDYFKRIRELSNGMKMKLSLAVALSHGSKLLILDEPTNGIDPVARDEIIEMLIDFTRQEDHSILISSHIVSDLEKICDYVAFMHKGNLLVCEEKDILLSRYGLIRCSREEIERIAPDAIKHVRHTDYFSEAVVLRNKVPENMNLMPIGIEELFVAMVKEG